MIGRYPPSTRCGWDIKEVDVIISGSSVCVQGPSYFLVKSLFLSEKLFQKKQPKQDDKCSSSEAAVMLDSQVVCKQMTTIMRTWLKIPGNFKL